MDIKILQAIREFQIFSTLTDDQLNQLVELMELVKIKPGENLFEQGSESDCVYLLIQGLLVAIFITSEGKEKIIGTILRGQLVGEMGLISSLPRSLTVRALRQSTLVKLNKESFKNFFLEEPEILVNIINLVIKRSQKTITALVNVQKYTNIALLPANTHVPMKDFLAKLKRRLADFPRIEILTAEDYQQMKSTQLINAWLNKSDVDYDCILFEIDINNPGLADIFLEHTDRLLIVGEGNSTPMVDDYVRNTLANKNYSLLKKELILLFQDNQTPKNTHGWLEQTNFWRRHNIRLNQNDDYARLLRFISGEALGLVLSGGGTRAWVEVGAIRALKESNITIDAVGGSSIGALIGALYLYVPKL